MSHVLRKDSYREFIASNFEDSPSRPVYSSSGTNCAIFARGCLVQAGILPRGRRPLVTGITSWLDVTWFGEDWVAAEDLGDPLDIWPGDVLYWCGGQSKMWRWAWKSATNGHVGIALFDGEGHMQRTGEGGGPDHLCRMSEALKDVRLNAGRPLRGVWRPELIWRRRLRKAGYLTQS